MDGWALSRTAASALLPLVLLVGCGVSVSGGYLAGTAPAVTVAPRAPVGEAAGDCARSLQKIPEPTSLGVTDPIAVATSNQVVALPVPGLPGRSIEEVVGYRSASDYLATAQSPDLKGRREAMERDGFREGVQVTYTSGVDTYSYIALRFANQAAAVDYLKVHVRDLCDTAATLSPIAGIAGVSYLRTDGMAKTAMIVGDTEVQLQICTCVEVQDRVDLARRWAVEVSRQLSAV